jgi:O-antigen/teichoic acid export membrane protein
MQDLGTKLKHGAAWSYLGGWTASVFTFASGVVLARLLEPADFGLFAAVSAYTAVLLMQVQFGIPSSLLQRKEVTDRQLNSAFWFMEGMALLSTTIVFGMSGWLGAFYGEPEYAEVMRWMCIPFFVIPFANIHTTILRREMKYALLAKMSVVLTFFGGGLSIILAATGSGVYTFVVAGIVGAFLQAVTLTYFAPWKPRLAFAFSDVTPLLGYAWRIHANNSAYLIANRVDNMLVGKLAGTAALGIYGRAFNLARLPLDELLTRLHELLFGGYSRIQEDLSHSRLLHGKVLCAMTSAIYPLLLVLIFAGEALIAIVYGEKWVAAAQLLQLLAIGSFATTLSRVLGPLADAQGLVGRELRIAIVNLVITVAVVLIGSHWGLLGIAAGIAIKDFVLLTMMQWLLKTSHVGLNWMQTLNAALPALIATLASSAAAVLVATLAATSAGATPMAHLMTQTLTICIVYAVVWRYLVVAMPWHESLQSTNAMFESWIIKGIAWARKKAADKT